MKYQLASIDQLATKGECDVLVEVETCGLNGSSFRVAVEHLESEVQNDMLKQVVVLAVLS